MTDGKSRLTSARDGNYKTETGIPESHFPPNVPRLPPLPPHISLPLSFDSGLVLSSLKACPHTPNSSLCSLNRLLARCSPNQNTHTDKKLHTQRDNNTPRCIETHVYVVVRFDCICRISLTSGGNKDNAFLFCAEANVFLCFPSH